MLKSILIVGLGGMIGSMARYIFALAIKPTSFPYATFTVNILGSFVIGLVMGYALKTDSFNNNGKLFLATGICGGFTTFSAFSLECIELLKQHRYSVMLTYILISIVLGLAATFAGVQLTKGN
jgi:CrcB protein